MSVLAHVFEAAGLATIALGSIRNQIERTAPPRGLYCDFPLGRPLGRPGDAAFQHRVLAHAFSLLERSEPIFEIFDEALPDDGASAVSCPLPPRHDPTLPPAVDEARGLRPAFDRAIAKYGDRAGTGRLIDADAIPDAVAAFVRIAEGTPWKEAGVPGVPARVAQDIRGYYETAALALIGHTPAAWETTRWFLHDTHTGRTIVAAREVMRDAGEKHPIWFYLVPGGI